MRLFQIRVIVKVLPNLLFDLFDLRIQLCNHLTQRIKHDFDRDFYMNPQQAKDYGIVDDILAPRYSETRAPVGLKS